MTVREKSPDPVPVWTVPSVHWIVHAPVATTLIAMDVGSPAQTVPLPVTRAEGLGFTEIETLPDTVPGQPPAPVTDARE